MRSGRVRSGRPSVPVELKCITLQEHGYVPQAGSSVNPTLLGVLWKLHHIGMIGYGLHLQLFSFLKRMGVRRWKCQGSNHMTWSSRWPAHRWPATQSRLIRKRCSYHPGNCKGFKGPVSGTRVKDQVSTKYAAVIASTIKINLKKNKRCS